MWDQREEASKITIQATGATSWRRNDVKYRKNEAFVDVVETVNLSMSSKGPTLSFFYAVFSPLNVPLLFCQEPSFGPTSMAKSS